MADSNSAVSPGGPRISSAKKRRLAALDQTHGSTKSSAKQQGRALPQARSSKAQKKGSGAGAGAAASSGAARSVSSGSAGGEQVPAGAAQQQSRGWEPPYNRLDDAIATGPAAEAMQLPAPQQGGRVVTELLEQLIAANPRAVNARAAIGLKVQDRTAMLDNPVGQKTGNSAAPGRKAGRKQREQPERQGGEATRLTYAGAQGLHASWRQYVRDLLQGAQDVEARLYAADLRGCLIRVTASKEARYHGLQGIVVRDTANTLQLVTPQDRLRVVPKQACSWEFDADRRRVVTLLGPGLAARGAGGRGMIGGDAPKKPKTLREAIRSQNKLSK